MSLWLVCELAHILSYHCNTYLVGNVWCFSYRNYSACDRLGCEWCSVYCHNGSAVQDEKLKRCDYLGQCCKKDEPEDDSPKFKIGSVIAGVLIPVFIIAIIVLVWYLYKLGWRVDCRKYRRRAKRHQQMDEIPDVIANVDIECWITWKHWVTVLHIKLVYILRKMKWIILKTFCSKVTLFWASRCCNSMLFNYVIMYYYVPYKIIFQLLNCCIWTTCKFIKPFLSARLHL